MGKTIPNKVYLRVEDDEPTQVGDDFHM